ncbi:MAG: DUF1080 domain-containing protein, partial [Proteobacteria bacterium]|nr:DUF1080 domain-containing protein [Pseudomonadota bacterium]
RLYPQAEPVALYDGSSLDHWNLHTEDASVRQEDVATVTDGVLHIAGSPYGYLQTERWFRDYALDLEWRWPDGEDGNPRAGNSGVLVHTTAPFIFYTWPRSLEVQLQSGSAGDFWVIGDGVDIRVENEAERRVEPVDGDLHSHRRIRNLTDDSERELGTWNHMRIEARGDELRVWVNDELVNHGTACTVSEGAIALQSEGTPVEFRDIQVTPLTE